MTLTNPTDIYLTNHQKYNFNQLLIHFSISIYYSTVNEMYNKHQWQAICICLSYKDHWIIDHFNCENQSPYQNRQYSTKDMAFNKSCMKNVSDGF